MQEILDFIDYKVENYYSVCVPATDKIVKERKEYENR